jgi:hypothetical protein
MALIGETKVLLLNCQPSQEFVEHGMNSNLLGQRATLMAIVQASAESSPGHLADLVGKVSPAPGQLYGLAIARVALSPVNDDVYLDRPNVFSYHERIRLDDDGGLIRSNSLDIVASDVAVRPSAEPFHVRLVQGLVDTAAENLSIGGCHECSPAENVSELRAFSQSAEMGWLPVRTLDELARRDLSLSDDARRRIEQDIRAGYAVLLPARPVTVEGRIHLGWWRIDPASGSTLGLMESGEGQAMTEYRVIGAEYAAGFIGMLSYCDCMEGLTHESRGKTVACLACTVIAGATAATVALSLGTTTPAAAMTGRALAGALGAATVCAIAGIT